MNPGSSSENFDVKVAVVLLSYNCKHLLEELLPIAVSTTNAAVDCKLFVVDNGSSDGTQEFMREHYPETDLIRIEVNRGFTNGYAESLPQINAQYYVLLSSDVEVTEGWIDPVVQLMDSDSSIAIVQPKIRSYHVREEFEYAGASGGYIDTHGYPFCRGRIFFTVEKDKGQYDSIEEVFWASGACFFIRSDVYHSTGGLDDDFFAHMEEIDLCWRVKNLGYKVMVCPQSRVFHMGGAVITYGSPAKTFRNHRNNLIMMIKNLPGSEAIWKLPFRFGMDYIAFVKMILGGQIGTAFAIPRAHLSFVRSLGKWLKKRKEIQNSIKTHTRSGIYPKSIVAAYFLKRKYTFDKLNWRP